MIAAVLHLHESAGVAVDVVDRVHAVPRRRHDVADRDARAIVRPRSRVELFVIAEDAVDFRHAGELLGRGLRRAAGDDDATRRAARA